LGSIGIIGGYHEIFQQTEKVMGGDRRIANNKKGKVKKGERSGFITSLSIMRRAEYRRDGYIWTEDGETN